MEQLTRVFANDSIVNARSVKLGDNFLFDLSGLPI